MPGGLTLLIAGGVAFVTLVGIIILMFTRGDEAVEERLGELTASGRSSGSGGSGSYPGSRRSTRSSSRGSDPREDGRRKLEKRLMQAGLYRKNSTFYFLLTQVVLLTAAVGLGFAAAGAGLASRQICLLSGTAVGIAAIITPGFVLDFKKGQRQTAIRRALPDALDVIVVCMEAGLSLPMALVRVGSELKTAHPMLAAEMTIVHREIQLGHATGQAMKNFADRFDLDELRSLASVIQQAEKYGASITSALRVHAEDLRRKRFQQAQERAQKASVKLLFPTVLFIFPALFVVVLGPAAYDIFELLREINSAGM